MCTLVSHKTLRFFITSIQHTVGWLKKKIKKRVTHSGSNKPMVGFIGTFHRYCVLGHSANAEDTILAGRSVASPKAPPYGSL